MMIEASWPIRRMRIEIEVTAPAGRPLIPRGACESSSRRTAAAPRRCVLERWPRCRHPRRSKTREPARPAAIEPSSPVRSTSGVRGFFLECAGSKARRPSSSNPACTSRRMRTESTPILRPSRIRRVHRQPRSTPRQRYDWPRRDRSSPPPVRPHHSLHLGRKSTNDRRDVDDAAHHRHRGPRACSPASASPAAAGCRRTSRRRSRRGRLPGAGRLVLRAHPGVPGRGALPEVRGTDERPRRRSADDPSGEGWMCWPALPSPRRRRRCAADLPVVVLVASGELLQVPDGLGFTGDDLDAAWVQVQDALAWLVPNTCTSSPPARTTTSRNDPTQVMAVLLVIERSRRSQPRSAPDSRQPSTP